jgi:hypothetical protein
MPHRRAPYCIYFTVIDPPQGPGSSRSFDTIPHVLNGPGLLLPLFRDIRVFAYLPRQ